MREIERLLTDLPAEETVVFQDEVDVHLNPKIGSCWMRRGQQDTVVTPGNNEKRHVAGSLHWRTGGLLVSTPGRRRNSQLFLEHLDDLRRRLRGFRRIHVVCDNAAFHCSRVALSGSLEPPHPITLPAEICARNEPDRTRVVALPRDHHSQPPLSRPGRVARTGPPMVRQLPTSLLQRNENLLQHSRMSAPLKRWGHIESRVTKSGLSPCGKYSIFSIVRGHPSSCHPPTPTRKTSV